jgi:hypothetical protein
MAHNNTAAFMAAINAQPSGGFVYIPPGKYLFEQGSHLRITRRVSLVGAGPRQTTLIMDGPGQDLKLIEYAGAVLNSSVRSSTRLARIPTQAFRGTNVLNIVVGQAESVHVLKTVAVCLLQRCLCCSHKRSPSTARRSQWGAGSL